MVALHATDPTAVYISAWARMRAFRVEQMEDALYERRSLTRLLGMRRTMFVLTAPLARIVDAACTRPVASAHRRRTIQLVEKSGLTDDGRSWLRKVEKQTLAALSRLGSATGSEISAAVPELRRKIAFGEGKKWAGSMSMTTHVLILLAAQGRIVRGKPRGTWTSSQYAWELVESLDGGAAEELDEADARAELVRHWLHAFGPGTEADLRWWAGWTARDTRAALARLDVAEVEIDGGVGYVLADDLEPVAEPDPWIALLPALDPTVMGWKLRDWYLGTHARQLFDRNGNAGPTVWADGRIVGGWAQRPDGDVVVKLLEDVGKRTETAVLERAAELTAWLRPIVVKPRFRTPLEKKLSA